MEPSTIIGQVNRSMNAGVPALDQMSSSNPGFNPGNIPPSSAPMPNGSPMTGVETALHRHFKRNNMAVPQQLQPQQPEITLPVQDANPSQSGTQIPVSEVELVLRALSKHLDHKNKIEDKLLNTILPTQNDQTT